MRPKIGARYFLFLLIALMLIVTSCGDGAGDQSRRESINGRWENFERAEALHPEPSQQNFPLRELLVEYTERQDLVNHLWYTYVLGENGNAVYYFVSTTLPVNVCAFLSSTEDIDDYNDLILTAPSLDGIYYGGAGASASCNGWIVKDAATNAMGVIHGDKLLIFDQPLILDAEPVRIQIAPTK